METYVTAGEDFSFPCYSGLCRRKFALKENSLLCIKNVALVKQWANSEISPHDHWSLQAERPWDYPNLCGFHQLGVNLYPGPHWDMDKPKGGSGTIKFSCVSINFLNVLFSLSVTLYWLLKLLLLAFRGKEFSFLGIYFANVIRKIPKIAFDISKMFSTLPFSLREMLHLEVTKCCT